MKHEKFQAKILFLIAEERDEIHKEFSSSILDLQQKSGLRYLVLQNKVYTHEIRGGPGCVILPPQLAEDRRWDSRNPISEHDRRVARGRFSDIAPQPAWYWTRFIAM